MIAAWMGNSLPDLTRVYALGRREALEREAEFLPWVITEESAASRLRDLRQVEALFCTWGMFAPSQVLLDNLPRLKAVFYAAGSVKHFALPYLKRGVQVTAAPSVNAAFVTDFAVSEILLALKGFYPAARGRKVSPPGITGSKIGILGAGNVGRQVIAALLPKGVELLLYDPTLSQEEAAELGCQKAELDELFSTCQVVSNHAPNLPSTRGMLQGCHFERMPENGVFLNTGRGATVVEADLIRVMEQRQDLTALLDVTDPEPPLANSPLYALPNVILTPHVAGALGNEVVAMADLMAEEFARLKQDEPLQYAVRLADWDKLA